ncbi:MAG: hypothetical protein AAGI09_08355 [Pseudomonadota bacterium]
MRVLLKETNEEMLVLAIFWPSSESTIPNPFAKETLFSVYDGHAISEAALGELEVLDPRIENFVLTDEDERVVMLVWAPLNDTQYWLEVREHEPSALARLKDLVREAPEFK